MYEKKLEYLAKTFSRTNGKKYENYVVNAIWNGVKSNTYLVPVTQQCVKAKDHYYYIDLYFPQINIGVECDEAHHLNQVEADKSRENDIEKMLTPKEPDVFDALNHIRVDEFEMIRIEAHKGYDEIEKQIKKCIERINQKIKDTKITNGWSSIVLADPVEYYKEKEYITNRDDVRFSNNAVAYNTILGKNYTGSRQNGGIRIDNEYYSWFPEINKVADESNKNDWQNQISKDGKYIYERKQNSTKEKIEESKKEVGCLKVTFVKVKNEYTGKKDYRFAGVYKCVSIVADEENNYIKTYEKVNDKFKIIR